METKAEIYIPAVFRSFQGFQIRDIREWRESLPYGIYSGERGQSPALLFPVRY